MNKSKALRSTATILAASILLLTANLQAAALGKIVEISTEKDSYKKGEVIEVYVKVQSFQQGKKHHIVALNMISPKDEMAYDSHELGEDPDFLIKKDEIKTIGPFKIETKDIKKGTYYLLAGYKVYPWEPEIAYQGMKWCPPVKTIEIK